MGNFFVTGSKENKLGTFKRYYNINLVNETLSLFFYGYENKSEEEILKRQIFLTESFIEIIKETDDKKEKKSDEILKFYEERIKSNEILESDEKKTTNNTNPLIDFLAKYYYLFLLLIFIAILFIVVILRITL